MSLEPRSRASTDGDLLDPAADGPLPSSSEQAEDSAPARPVRRLLGLVGAAVLWLVLIVMGAVALALVILPLVLGWTPLTVRTGSMEPTIPTGSQVVVSPVESQEQVKDLEVGNVITFMPFPDDDTTVTHRVVERAVRADGQIALSTQGDANDDVDPWTLGTDQIRGEVRYHLPYAGYAAQLLDGQQKSIGLVVVIAALIGYVLWQIVQTARERVTRRPAEPAGPVGSEEPAESER